MPRNRKPDLYQLLKQTGAPMTTSYMEYKTADLEAELTALGVDISDLALSQIEPPPPKPKRPRGRPRKNPLPPQDGPPPVPDLPDLMDLPDPYRMTAEPVRAQYPNVPRSNTPDPDEMPSQRQNTSADREVIRIDDQGRHWYQEEVRKPAYPKPRGRRILKYLDRGVKTETVQNGEYIETFEVAGEGTPRPAEVKITLPSYQVGIYKDARFPFRIHCYDGREGFDLFEVHRFYGGSELVPDMCKRVYIENVLCYDIRSVIRAIQAEHRQMQLMGRA